MSNPTFTFTLVDATGAELEVSLPAKFVVCHRCEGKGSHVNPSIDGNGLSREDFDADPDFAEGYMRGDYDIACQTCKGRRVVSQVDRKQLTPLQKRQLARHEKAEADYQRDYDSERWLRMAESGERW
jgi:hypothetical protein